MRMSMEILPGYLTSYYKSLLIPYMVYRRSIYPDRRITDL